MENYENIGEGTEIDRAITVKAKKRRKKKADSIKRIWVSGKFMSFMALIVSAGTMFIITYQNHLIKKQQYASVLPYLSIIANSGNVVDNNLMSYEIYLSNNGIGPAFIDNIRITHKNNQYDNLGPFVHKEFLGSKPDLRYSFNSNVSRGFVLPAGVTYPLILSLDSASANFLHKLLQDVEFEITYSSVYEETWKIDKDNSIPQKME